MRFALIHITLATIVRIASPTHIWAPYTVLLVYAVTSVRENLIFVALSSLYEKNEAWPRAAIFLISLDKCMS